MDTENKLYYFCFFRKFEVSLIGSPVPRACVIWRHVVCLVGTLLFVAIDFIFCPLHSDLRFIGAASLFFTILWVFIWFSGGAYAGHGVDSLNDD